MSFPGAEVAVGIVSALIVKHKIDQWAKLIVSLVVSGMATFLSVFGLTLSGLLSTPATYNRIGWNVAFSVATASAASAGAIYWKWRTAKLSKGESAMVPADIKGPPEGFLKE